MTVRAADPQALSHQLRQRGDEARRIVEPGHETKIGDAQLLSHLPVLDADLVQGLQVIRDE